MKILAKILTIFYKQHKAGHTGKHYTSSVATQQNGELKMERLLERNWGINKTKTQQKQQTGQRNGKNYGKKQLGGKKLAMC